MDKLFKKVLLILALLFGLTVGVCIFAFALDQWPERIGHKWSGDYTRTNMEMIFAGGACVIGMIISVFLAVGISHIVYKDWKR